MLRKTWEIMKSRSQLLVRDGKALQLDEENITELTRLAKKVVSKRVL